MLGPAGKPVRPTMGCYGIGVSRRSRRSPSSTTTTGGWSGRRRSRRATYTWWLPGKGPQLDAALDLGGRLAAAGLRVLVDDRTHVSAGVKFTDAELIGIPRAVVVGRRLADGYVELRDRAGGERIELPLDGLVERLVDEVRAGARERGVADAPRGTAVGSTG